MGKRSNFERKERDFYPTPKEAVIPLFPYVRGLKFVEPCAGDGQLITILRKNLPECVFACDIEPLAEGIVQQNVLDLNVSQVKGADVIITNPPWSRNILHPLIDHLRQLKPTWLLFDANWMFTKQSVPYLKYCEKIVTVGRVKWIPDSKYTGKDDCCWYKFIDKKTETRFYGKTPH